MPKSVNDCQVVPSGMYTVLMKPPFPALTSLFSVWAVSFLPRPGTRPSRRDLRRRHQIANILLEELIIAIQLVVFLLDCLDSIEYLEKGFVKVLRVSVVAFFVSGLYRGETLRQDTISKLENERVE
jgi:hypothetical protein